MIKLVADAECEVLIGATSVGPRGGEVLFMFTLAVHARLPLRTWRSMIYAFLRSTAGSTPSPTCPSEVVRGYPVGGAGET